MKGNKNTFINNIADYGSAVRYLGNSKKVLEIEVNKFFLLMIHNQFYFYI